MDDYKITLSENEIPQKWYNVIPDLVTPLPPPLKPDGSPIGPKDLAPIFPMELIKQEMSQERWIEIPDEIRRIWRLWRPSPLRRAHNLEKALGTPARIYYKDESVSPAGSHKPNTAVAQVYYNKQEGVKTIATETGAGQWGSALSFATQLFGLNARVYMVKVSYEQKPYRKMLMRTWGGECFSSPTTRTQAGKAILEKDPDSLGSLGIAISEAVEDAATHDDVKYSLGSVLNHVCTHQTIIGLETKKQLKIAGESSPDTIIGCVGGGSNFAGLAFPFVKDKIDGKEDYEIIAVEPTACPTLTKGPYRYDHGDTAKMTPLMKMYTLGHDFVPPGIHAGGLRYHGDAPLLCSLVNDKVIKARAYHQIEVFDAAVQFARTEGMVCAPETAHAVKAAIDEAEKCKETGEEKCIVFNYSGHGFFDLSSYEAYFDGKLEEYEYPDELIKKSIASLPDID
ncbi:MAG: TrpB-like pyridoxal phosphate-dependent enzyme [Elusimicrobia bacterium]|jgi:tryptophan synthase beta chain|nr:TrpB-like pyridoxal phosphate-dependent enzyme [Elusimicrobiota bacterium]